MHQEHNRRNIALLVLSTGIIMFVLMLIFVLPYFMSEKKYGEMQAALNAGDYYKVFKISQFLLSQDPESLQAYYFRGQAYAAKRNYTAAERDLEKVIKINVQYSNMRSVGVQLGEIYHKHGLSVILKQPDMAYRLLIKAQKFLPRELSLKRERAQAAYYVGLAVEGKDTEKALKYYSEAVKYNATEASYKMALGRNLIKTTSLQQGVNLMNEAVNAAPELKTKNNLMLLENALWKLVTAKERDFYEGKLKDVKEVNALLDNILQINKSSKDAILEKFAIAINGNNFTDAKKILTDAATNSNIILPMHYMNLLTGSNGTIAKPSIVFSGGNDTDAEVKLDSELSWSSDGSKLIVKAMDKSTSETRVLSYRFKDKTILPLQTSAKINWQDKIFSPAADGVILISDKTIYKLEDETSKLYEFAVVDGTVFDVDRDGQGVLLASGNRLYRYNFQTKRKNSIYISSLTGDFLNAVYSPQNKRIAVVAGKEENKKLGVSLGKGRSKILAEGDISNVKWSWDGKNVYYGNTTNNISAVFLAAADGKNEPFALTEPELNVESFEASPIDNYLIIKGASNKELLLLNQDGKDTKALTPRFGQIGKFVWSPDGSKAAYLFSPVKGGPVRLEVVDVLRF